jgi:hypothetical protein
MSVFLDGKASNNEMKQVLGGFNLSEDATSMSDWP